MHRIEKNNLPGNANYINAILRIAKTRNTGCASVNPWKKP